MAWAHRNGNLTGSWEWLEEKLMSNVNNKMSFASLWFYLYPPAELDNRVVNFSWKTAELVHKMMEFLLYLVQFGIILLL